MLNPASHLALFDEDIPTIRAALANLDAFISSHHSSTAEQAIASHQRESLILELEERLAGEVICAGFCPSSAPLASNLPVWAPTPPHVTTSFRYEEDTVPTELPTEPPLSFPLPPLLPLAQRIRAAQRKENGPKLAERRDRVERAERAAKAAEAERFAAIERADAAQRAAQERLRANAAQRKSPVAMAPTAVSVPWPRVPPACSLRRSTSPTRNSLKAQVTPRCAAAQAASSAAKLMAAEASICRPSPPLEPSTPHALMMTALYVEECKATARDAVDGACGEAAAEDITAKMAEAAAAEEEEEEEEETAVASSKTLSTRMAACQMAEASDDEDGRGDSAAAQPEEDREGLTEAGEETWADGAMDHGHTVIDDEEPSLVPRPPREPIYEAAFDATSSPRAHTPLDQCAATRNVEFDHATLLPTDFDGGGENERGAAAVTWEYPVPCHTEVVDRGAGHCSNGYHVKDNLAEAAQTPDYAQEDDVMEEEETEEEQIAVEEEMEDGEETEELEDRPLDLLVSDSEVEAALRAIDQGPTLVPPPTPLPERRVLLDRLRRMYPHANESALAKSLDDGGLDFEETVSNLYRHHLLGASARGATSVVNSRRHSSSTLSDGGTPSKGEESFVAPLSRFDELFFIGTPPTLELLRHCVQSNMSLSDALAPQHGGPSAAWEWRYVRVALAKPEVYEIMREVIRISCGEPRSTGGLRLAELPGCVGQRQHAGTWNMLWTWRQPKLNWEELLPWQRVNHFPQARQLTRKDLLKKHLQRQRQRSERAGGLFDIMPLTFALPKESLAFTDAFSRCADDAKGATDAAGGGAPRLPNVWILKPVGLSRGRGISMVDCITDVTYGEQMVIQQYVSNPLLLDGYKFDLRLYVLVTSFKPLEAFVYREGFGRFATEPYSLAPNQRHNLFAHLTNSSINKEERADGSCRAKSVPSLNAAEGGTKVALSQLRKRLAAAGVNVDALWGRVIDVVLRSLYAVHESIGEHAPTNSFELFGYDILIDDELKPWLIEVNASPSLARDNPLDCLVKEALLADTLALVSPPYFDRTVWREMLRWRAAERAGGGRGGVAPSFAAEMCALLHGTTPRAHGRPPASCGSYECIAPSPAWAHILGGRHPKSSSSLPRALPPCRTPGPANSTVRP